MKIMFLCNYLNLSNLLGTFDPRFHRISAIKQRNRKEITAYIIKKQCHQFFIIQINKQNVSITLFSIL